MSLLVNNLSYHSEFCECSKPNPKQMPNMKNKTCMICYKPIITKTHKYVS